MSRSKAVFLDVDGTLTIDTIPWKQVHDYFYPNDKLDVTIFEEELNFHEWAKEEVKSWKGKKYQDLQNALLNPSLRGGVALGIRKLRQFGFKVILLSGGIDEMVKNVIENIKVDHCASNSIIQKEGIITGEMDYKIGSKTEYISLLQDQMNIDPKSSVAVGNGENDVEMFKMLDYSIAFNPRTIDVANAATTAVYGNDFDQVVTLILENSA